MDSLMATGDSVSRNIASVGFRVGVLRQEISGFDLALGVMYKTQGFTETTGELEFSVMASRWWNRFGVFANFVYGQGFISTERDGEGRLAALYAINDRLNVGLDARCRFDLGDGDPNRIKRPGEADFDLVVGPVATLAFGPVLVQAQAGPHTVFIDSTGFVATGVAAIGGVGAAF
jgi:hypothetical protein